MAGPEVARVASIMLDCNNLDNMVAFWGAILDVKVKNRFPNYVWMTRVSRGGSALAFQQVTEQKDAKNRLHLDLSTDDPESLVAHVEELGGVRLEDHEIAGFHWTVCADPELKPRRCLPPLLPPRQRLALPLPDEPRSTSPAGGGR